MSKRMTVEEHYSRGRTHPYGRVIDDGAENSIKREPSFESGNKQGAFNKPDVQDPEDRHNRQYNNDHRDNWVRGGGEDATSKPGYDHDPVWKRANKGDTWNSPSDKVTLQKGGDENEWARRGGKS
jgi:hypothetical protein